MSITSPDDRITAYAPTVATSVFAADFPVFDNSDLAVYHNGIERTDFTVQATYENGISENARVVFATGIVGSVLVVGDRVPHRTNRFGNGAPLKISDLNLALDALESEMQEIARNVARSFKVFFGDAPTTVPLPVANRVLGWDENGHLANLDPQDFVNAAGYASAQQGAYADLFHSIMPNAGLNIRGVGAPGFDGGNLFFFNAPDPFDVRPTLRVDRRADVGSGNSGDTHKAIWAYGTSGPYNAGFEWTFTTELHNKALGSLGSQNVAFNATAFKETNGIGPVGKTWGGNIVAHDKTGEINPIYGLIGLEVNAFAEAGGADLHRQRVGLHLALCGFAGTHVGYGLVIGAHVGAVVDRGIAFQGPSEGAGDFGIGIDMSDGVFSSAAMMMKETHRIVFDGVYSGAFNRSLRYEAGRLRYSVVSSEVFAIADDGIVFMKGFNLQNPDRATSATAGTAGAIPAQVAGYLTVPTSIGTIKIPYLNP